MHGLSKATANVSMEALRVELSGIHKRAQSITAERADLALPATLGDTKAKARIAEIDAERALCAARTETLEHAIRALQKQEQQTGWKKHLPNMERALHAELTDVYRNQAQHLGRLMLGRQSHDVRHLREALNNLDRLEHDTARMIADRLLPQARMPFHTAGDQAALNRARKEHVKLIALRNQQIGEAVQEMLASSNVKRPASLEEALARARQRLEVGG